jgi:HSP20 family molecular chaperone IbpA
MTTNLSVRPGATPQARARRPNDLFSDLFGFDPLRNYPAYAGASTAIGMEITRTETGYTVELPVPGFRPEQIDITVQGETLVVSGNSERRRFTTSLMLPEEIDPDKISANVENGMLILRLEQRPEQQPRRITVQAGQSGQSSGGTVPTVSGTTQEQNTGMGATSGTSAASGAQQTKQPVQAGQPS